MSRTTTPHLTAQDKIMLRDGYVRITIVANALGMHGSTMLRRVHRAVYKGVMASKFWYVRLDDIYSASDTSEPQRAELSRVLDELQKSWATT